MTLHDDNQASQLKTSGAFDDPRTSQEERTPQTDELVLAEIHQKLGQIEHDLEVLAAGRLRPLMSRQEVAEYLGTSLRFVDGLIAERKLVPIKLGRLRRFDPGAVEAFVRKAAGGARRQGVR